MMLEFKLFAVFFESIINAVVSDNSWAYTLKRENLASYKYNA